jgi:hypothetical protein
LAASVHKLDSPSKEADLARLQIVKAIREPSQMASSSISELLLPHIKGYLEFSNEIIRSIKDNRQLVLEWTISEVAQYRDVMKAGKN